MNAFVTGATGHLGNTLVRALLDAGHEVAAGVFEPSPSLRGLACEQVPVDVTDPASLEPAFDGADVVFNLAAVISIDGDRSGRVARVNIDGPGNVARAAHAAGVRRVVHVSSIHAFATEPADEPLTEDRPRGIDAPHAYDRSKARGEMALRRAAEDVGLDHIVLHPAGCVGPYDFEPSRMGRTLLDMAADRRRALPDGGFSWVDVRDVAASIARGATDGDSGQSYLLPGTWTTLHELARLVGEARGRALKPVRVPLWMALAGSGVLAARDRMRGRSPLVTPESMRTLATYREIDGSRAAADLGHSVRPLAETIADTLEWHGAQGNA